MNQFSKPIIEKILLIPFPNPPESKSSSNESKVYMLSRRKLKGNLDIMIEFMQYKRYFNFRIYWAHGFMSIAITSKNHKIVL